MKQTFSQVVGATAAITLGLLPDMAEAQGPPPDPARRAELVKRFDADGDGILSPAEIETARAARKGRGAKHAAVGKTPAHKSSDTETSAAGNDQVIERLLRQFDLDGNGKLSFAEMDALRAFMKTQPSRESRAGSVAAPHHPPAKTGGKDHE